MANEDLRIRRLAGLSQLDHVADADIGTIGATPGTAGRLGQTGAKEGDLRRRLDDAIARGLVDHNYADDLLAPPRDELGIDDAATGIGPCANQSGTC